MHSNPRSGAARSRASAAATAAAADSEPPDVRLYGFTVGPSLLARDRHRRQSSRVVEGRTCRRIEKKMALLMSAYDPGDPSWREDEELVYRMSRLRKQLRYRRRLDGFRAALSQAKPTWTLDDGTSALHTAAQYGHLEMVRDLLAKGWSINATDARQQTPLILASKEGHPRVVKLLLQGSSFGGTPNLKAKDSLAMTCIGWAAKQAARQTTKSRGCSRVVEMLEAAWAQRQRQRRRKARKRAWTTRRRELKAAGELGALEEEEEAFAEAEQEDDQAEEEYREEELASDSDPESSVYEDFEEEEEEEDDDDDDDD